MYSVRKAVSKEQKVILIWFGRFVFVFFYFTVSIISISLWRLNNFTPIKLQKANKQNITHHRNLWELLGTERSLINVTYMTPIIWLMHNIRAEQN